MSARRIVLGMALQGMGALRWVQTAVIALCVLIAALVLASAPALAAPPMPPKIEGESFSDITSIGVTLNATANAGGSPTSYQFEYGTSAAYGSTTPLTSLGSGEAGVAVQAAIGGLKPDTVYHFRAVATNEEGEVAYGSDTTFTTDAVVEDESFSDVGSSSAALGATINPAGSLTKTRFEYGTSTAYGSLTPPTPVGAGPAAVSVLADIGGLQPETLYHYRAVATNEEGEVAYGPDATFMTFTVAPLGLPDDRGYELVSALDNANGNVYEPYASNVDHSSDNTQRPFQAAADGDAMAYVSDPSATGGSGSEGNEGGNEYLSTRSPSGGWTAQPIEAPTRSYDAVEDPVYQGFSSNLSVGILSYDGTPLTPSAPGGRYYVLYSRATSDGAFSPLFTITPPNRQWYDFEAYGIARHSSLSSIYAGISANLEHVLFIANDALTPPAEQAVPTQEENDLYDSVDGKLYLVNVLPDGTPAPDAIFGAPLQRGKTSIPEEEPTIDSPDFSHVISQDGSRIFWTDLHTDTLYVRENDDQPQSPIVAGKCTVAADACTVQVDLAEPGAGTSGGGRFWTASSDGSKVFFTDENRLTTDSTAGPEEPDLYECELVQGAGESNCRLKDLTVDASGPANVQGVLGAGETGSDVYFVADGVLGDGAEEGATTQNCDIAESTGLCNLYVVHEGEAPRFIAALSGHDDKISPFSLNFAVYGDWRPGLGDHTAEVTPDGAHLVFMSQSNLTGYESEGQDEIYIYDREGDGGKGELSCVSCNPGGSSRGVQGAFLQVSFSNTYLPRWMSADGDRVFFDTAEALAPQDTNGEVDVYEWERAGTGSCRHSTGCIYLLSGGTSPDNSYFADAGETGDDVFIISRAALVPQEEENETFAVYDARVGAPQPLSSPECSGTGCQGVPGAPPIFATPSSVTFSGVGNFPPPPTKPAVKPKKQRLTGAQKLARALRACRKKRSRGRRVACEAQARRRYGAKSTAGRPAKGRK
jgi:hypothetical protein